MGRENCPHKIDTQLSKLEFGGCRKSSHLLHSSHVRTPSRTGSHKSRTVTMYFVYCRRAARYVRARPDTNLITRLSKYMAIQRPILLTGCTFLSLHSEESQLGKSPQASPENPARRVIHDPFQQLHHCHPHILSRMKEPET